MSSTLEETSPPPAQHRASAYGSPFWLTYGSAVCVMSAVSLMFRYADFVEFLGGDEWHLGWIVGIGSVGSLVMRLAQGTAVDHYGPRRIWLWSLALLIGCFLAHLMITRLDGPAVYAVRILFATCVAGTFGSSITYLSLRVPIERMAEVIGVCGTAGFVGMMIGPEIGDWIWASVSDAGTAIQYLFLTAAGFVCCAWVFAFFATRGEVHSRPMRRPPMLPLLLRYRPGAICIIALIMGIGFGLPSAFVKAYATDLGINDIAVFFVTYGATAFVVRLLTFRWPQRFGIPVMILVGVTFQTLSVFAYLAVTSERMFILPALLQGIAHAFLFPSIMAGGGAAFPARYRGLATSLMMGMMDVGVLVGAPLIGSILHFAPMVGLAAYPTMFVTLGAVLAGVGIYYAVSVARAVNTVPTTTLRPKEPIADAQTEPEPASCAS